MKRPVTLATIERFLTITGWGASRFGRAACSDPGFVRDLRRGKKSLGEVREQAVAEFIEGYVRDLREQAKKLGRLVR